MNSVDLCRCNICGEALGEYEVHTEIYKYLGGYNVDMKTHGYPEDCEDIRNLRGYVCTKCAVKRSGAKKLYHLSRHCHVTKEFTPRIPDNRARDEDSSISRICLSDNIEGCLSAVPWGGAHLADLFLQEHSSLIRVYEFDITDDNIDNILPPEYLYQNDLVCDAFEAREYWYINKDLKPSRTYLIKLSNYEECIVDNIMYHDLISIYMDESRDVGEFIDGHFTKIEDVRYEVVPEERRSAIFDLDHIIKGVEDVDLNVSSIEERVINLFPDAGTWVEVNKEDDLLVLQGQLDTQFMGECDTLDMLDHISSNVSVHLGDVEVLPRLAMGS